MFEIVTEPRWYCLTAMTCGKLRTFELNKYDIPFSNKNDTPIAVINAAIRGEFRSGR